MKGVLFWYITPYSLLRVIVTFRRKVLSPSSAEICFQPGVKLICCSPHSSKLKMKAGVPPKRRVTFNFICSVTSLKITSVTTSTSTLTVTQREHVCIM
jgi:hypothetical protein